MPSSRAYSCGTWSCNILHSFIPLIKSTINIAIGTNVVVTVFFKNFIVRLCCWGNYHIPNIKIIGHPALFTNLNGTAAALVAGVYFKVDIFFLSAPVWLVAGGVYVLFSMMYQKKTI